MDQGLIYILLDLATAKLFVFVDSFFANNKDLRTASIGNNMNSPIRTSTIVLL
jgi:hypothetical protein